nr:hypothetical protein [Tanacetum cinerariifolium]
SGGKGICGGGEDQGDNGDAGGEDIARTLATSESVHAGIGTGAGIEIIAVVRIINMILLRVLVVIILWMHLK